MLCRPDRSRELLEEKRHALVTCGTFSQAPIVRAAWIYFVKLIAFVRSLAALDCNCILDGILDVIALARYINHV
jgi:hypothetical protein